MHLKHSAQPWRQLLNREDPSLLHLLLHPGGSQRAQTLASRWDPEAIVREERHGERRQQKPVFATESGSWPFLSKNGK